jgi:hypothetical protein
MSIVIESSKEARDIRSGDIPADMRLNGISACDPPVIQHQQQQCSPHRPAMKRAG